MEPDADEELGSAVANALGLQTEELGAVREVRRFRLEYDAFLAHRTLNRLQGEALVSGAVHRWSLIEKRTEGPTSASPYLLDNGRRELAAYRSGILDNIAPGIRAPRLYGSMLDRDGGMTLWLEEVFHDGGRPMGAEAVLAAARNLGGMAGRWNGSRLIQPWYFNEWVDRHSQPEAVTRSLDILRRARGDAAVHLGDRMRLVEHLIVQQSTVRVALEGLPHTLCHHDATGANVFHAPPYTVLIDWESVGAGPVGADLASLLFSSVRRGDASAHVVVPLLEDALEVYAEGVLAEGADVSPATVRRGFDAAVALRWKLAVDVVAGLENGAVPRRGSLPDEDPAAALQELIMLVDLLLASAERVFAHS